METTHTANPNFISGRRFRRSAPVVVLPVGTHTEGDAIEIVGSPFAGETVTLARRIWVDFEIGQIDGVQLEAWDYTFDAETAPTFTATADRVDPACASCGKRGRELFSTSVNGAVCGQCWHARGGGIEG